MIDIVNRLRFDAIRCEAQFSKGVAGNVTEAADEIERLRAKLRPFTEADWYAMGNGMFEGRVSKDALDVAKQP